MKNKTTILFDLDGTLTDPKVGITRSVQYALRKFGINVEDPDTLCCFIGPPLKESFMKYYGLSDADGELAVEYYREYYRPTGIFENGVYEGIPELLRDLRQAGKQIALATSKPTVFARQILVHYDIMQYFDVVIGSELDGRRVKKAEVVACALEECGCAIENAVMVGDRHHDIVGGRDNGLGTIGVLYGYGDRTELEEHGADLICETVSALRSALLG